MRRRTLLLAGCVFAAAAVALFLRRAELLRPALLDDVPAVQEGVDPPAAQNAEPEGQARLAAVEPNARNSRAEFGTTGYEVVTSPEGRLSVKGSVPIVWAPSFSINRTTEITPVIQVFDDRNAAVQVSIHAVSGIISSAGHRDVSYSICCDREDVPATVIVPLRGAANSVILPRAHVLRVRVETPDGAAVPFARVFWSKHGLSAETPTAYADEEGRCTLTRLAPTDVVSVQARPPATANPAAVSAEFTVAGPADQDLVLVVESESDGDVLRVRIEDAPQLRRAVAVLVREPGAGVVARCAVSNTATCQFANIPSGGSYTLWVAPRGADSPCVYAGGLRPGAQEVTVRAQPAQVLRVRPFFSGSPSGVRLTARRAGLSVEGVPETDGTYVFPGLPEGTVHVLGTAWSDGADVRLLLGEIDARGGEEVSLTLR